MGPRQDMGPYCGRCRGGYRRSVMSESWWPCDCNRPIVYERQYTWMPNYSDPPNPILTGAVTR